MGIAVEPEYLAGASLGLAIWAAIVASDPAPAPLNPRLWVAAVVAALPLLSQNRWVYLAATLLLCAFVVLGAASVGLLYVPAAVVMGIAMGLSFRRGDRRV